MRVLWAALLLGHIPAFATALAGVISGDAGSAGPRLLLVGLSLAFFALKLFDVPWLRITPSARAFGVFGICVLLLHADVLRRAHVVPAEEPTGAVVLFMTAGVLAALAGGIFGLRPAPGRTQARRARHIARAAFAVLARTLRVFSLPAPDMLRLRAAALRRVDSLPAPR